MTPFERIVAHYEREGADFHLALHRCRRHGFAVWNRDFFLMAAPVLRSALTWRKIQPVGAALADCWWIAGMSGDMEEAWEAEPYRLPWFAFERGKRLHIWRRDRIRRLTSRHLAHA